MSLKDLEIFVSRGVFKTQLNIYDEFFAKIYNGFYPLTIFWKIFLIDIWQGSKYVSGASFV